MTSQETFEVQSRQAITDLKSRDSKVRDKAALWLADNHVLEAVQPLIDGLNDRSLDGWTGTLAYALSELDTSHCKDQIVDLEDHPSFEVRMSIYSIIKRYGWIKKE